jgi:hypothetical protein
MAMTKQSRFFEFLSTPPGFIVVIDWMLFGQAAAAVGPQYGIIGNISAALFVLTIIVSIPCLLLLRKGHRLTRAAFVAYACFMVPSILAILLLVVMQIGEIFKPAHS